MLFAPRASPCSPLPALPGGGLGRARIVSRRRVLFSFFFQNVFRSQVSIRTYRCITWSSSRVRNRVVKQITSSFHSMSISSQGVRSQVCFLFFWCAVMFHLFLFWHLDKMCGFTTEHVYNRTWHFILYDVRIYLACIYRTWIKAYWIRLLVCQYVEVLHIDIYWHLREVREFVDRYLLLGPIGPEKLVQ